MISRACGNPEGKKWVSQWDKIRIYHECEGGIEKSVPRITDGIMRLAK